VKICYNVNAAVSTVRVDGESRDIGGYDGSGGGGDPTDV
jgi:hypothetical protein